MNPAICSLNLSTPFVEKVVSDEFAAKMICAFSIWVYVDER
jgi:hypothetical protein